MKVEVSVPDAMFWSASWKGSVIAVEVYHDPDFAEVSTEVVGGASTTMAASDLHAIDVSSAEQFSGVTTPALEAKIEKLLGDVSERDANIAELQRAASERPTRADLLEQKQAREALLEQHIERADAAEGRWREIMARADDIAKERDRLKQRVKELEAPKPDSADAIGKRPVGGAGLPFHGVATSPTGFVSVAAVGIKNQEGRPADRAPTAAYEPLPNGDLCTFDHPRRKVISRRGSVEIGASHFRKMLALLRNGVARNMVAVLLNTKFDDAEAVQRAVKSNAGVLRDIGLEVVISGETVQLREIP